VLTDLKSADIKLFRTRTLPSKPYSQLAQPVTDILSMVAMANSRQLLTGLQDLEGCHCIAIANNQVM
jgi:hypothetical protein